MKIRGWANWERGEEREKKRNEGTSEQQTKPAKSEGSGKGI